MAQDGRWHMVTLTTLPGELGFAMYLDGNQVAELNASSGLSWWQSLYQHQTTQLLQMPGLGSRI